MNSQEDHTNISNKSLSIPEPDPANITVLSENLPKSPILPWNNFDSPWLDDTADTDELKKEDAPEEDTVFPETKQSNSSLALLASQSNDESTEEQQQNSLNNNT